MLDSLNFLRNRESTVTLTDVIYQRRVAAVAHATEIDNIAQAARVFGIARQTLSGWIGLARERGLSSLWPKARRPGTQPNAMADWEIEIILAEAIARPTLGAGRLLEHLADRQVDRSRTGVQKVLNRHGLGTRAARVGALAALTTATTGQVTRDTDPGGFCLWAASAGDLVGLDAFYVGKLKGIGPVWQLTGCDTRSRWTVAELIIGRPPTPRSPRPSSTCSSTGSTRSGSPCRGWWSMAVRSGRPPSAPAPGLVASTCTRPHRDPRTTTASANGSRARCCTSSTGRPSTAVSCPTCRCSTGSYRPTWTATTPVAATTATGWPAAPHSTS